MLVLCAFLLTLLFSTRFIAALNAIEDQSAWAANLPQPLSGERENILIYSVTDSESESGVVTGIIIASCDFDNENFRLVHLPVNTLLEPDGHGFMRLAQVYSEGGAQTLTQSLSSFLKIPIHGYLEIDEAYLPTALDQSERLYSQLQLTNGASVLSMIHDDNLSPIELLQRRRQVLTAMATHVIEVGSLTRVQRFLELSPLMRTSFSWRRILSTMDSLKESSYQQSVQLIELPGKEQVNADGFYWLADTERFPALFEPNLDQPDLPQGEVPIEILNGSGASGLATELAQQLQDAGFIVVRTGNADHFDYVDTRVISRIENMDAAKDLAILIPNAQMLKEEQANSDVYVTIIIGKNYNSE